MKYCQVRMAKKIEKQKAIMDQDYCLGKWHAAGHGPFQVLSMV